MKAEYERHIAKTSPQDQSKPIAFRVGNHVITPVGWRGQIVDVRIVGGEVVFDVEHECGYPTNPFFMHELAHA